MFESFYGLSANPFRLSADERFRYAHRAYVKAWSYLKYALEQGEGFVLITGRPGTGKTTLIRDIQSELDESRLQAVNLVTNQFQSEELLRMVALGFGFDAHDYNKATLLTRIGDYALEQHAAGRRVIIIVDEAQNLTDNGLEELRLISNLQVGNQSLFQIFLVGQEELRSLIYGQGLENIQQRIVANCRIEPMDAQQVEGYIEHRLGVVGWLNDPQIDSGIYPLIQQLTQGIPREINHIVGRLLLYGALEEKHRLTEQDLWVVVEELNQEHRMGLERELEVERLKQQRGVVSNGTESAADEPSERDAVRPEAASRAVEVKADDTSGEEAVDGGGEPAQTPPPEAAGQEEERDDGAAPEAQEAGLGFDGSDALLQDRAEEDESKTIFGMHDVYAEDADSPTVLPYIELPMSESDNGRKPPRLFTDVDDLLDNDNRFMRVVRRIWRWIFYPVAIAVLLGMLLVPKPEEFLTYLQQLWSEFQQHYIATGSVAKDGGPLTSGAGDATEKSDSGTVTPQPEARTSDTASASVEGNGVADEEKRGETDPGAGGETGAAEVEAAQARPTGSRPGNPGSVSAGGNDAADEEKRVETDPGPDAGTGADEVEPTQVQAPRPEPEKPVSAPEQSADAAQGGSVDQVRHRTQGPLEFDRDYQLAMDETTGELAEPSRPLFFSTLAALRGNPRTLLIVTGIPAPGENPLEHMRSALKEAWAAATLFIEAGIGRERVSVEGGMPGSGKSHQTMPQDGLTRVSFRVVLVRQAPE